MLDIIGTCLIILGIVLLVVSIVLYVVDVSVNRMMGRAMDLLFLANKKRCKKS